MQEAAKACAAAARDVAGTFDVLETRDQLADRDPRLHARKRHAGAGMNAEAERQMAVGGTADIQPVRVGELLGIAISGADAQVDVAAGRYLHAAQFAVRRRAAIAELI